MQCVCRYGLSLHSFHTVLGIGSPVHVADGHDGDGDRVFRRIQDENILEAKLILSVP